MKVLLRNDGSKYYVWKDATYKNGHFIVNFPGYGDLGCNETEIIAVKDDNRSDSVSCSHCGAIIKNDPVAIEAHFAEQEAKKDCFKCPSLRRDKVKTTKVEFSKDIYDVFEVTETYKADLRCGQAYWNRPQIDTNDAKKVCVHYRCRNSGVQKIEDTFTKYPDLFDKHVTVDVLNEKKCAFDGRMDNFFEYDLKCRNTVKACVNEVGIVDHFIIKVRNHRYIAYYSAKYDKLFFSANGRDYEETMPYSMTENKYNQAKEKIAALYKEEESK
jgi:hypothetical protein